MPDEIDEVTQSHRRISEVAMRVHQLREELREAEQELDTVIAEARKAERREKAQVVRRRGHLHNLPHA